MALVQCHECGNEISAEAKVCPKCGAKNKSGKKSKIVTFGGGILLIIALLIAYVAFEHELNPNIPECKSFRGAKVFEDLVNKSPWALENKIHVIDVTNQTDVSSGSQPEDRVCEATLRFSNATDKTYRFSFKNRELGGYLVNARPK